MQANKLFILTGIDDGEILDVFPFNSYEEAYGKMKTIYEERVQSLGIGKIHSLLGAWGLEITYRQDGWEEVQMKMSILTTPHPGLAVALPDGRRLHASDKEDSGYPGIRIALLSENQKPGDAMGILWAEYSEERTDLPDEDKLRIMAWNAKEDEPQFILSYDSGKAEVVNGEERTIDVKGNNNLVNGFVFNSNGEKQN